MYNNHLRVINVSFVLDNYETNDSCLIKLSLTEYT